MYKQIFSLQHNIKPTDLNKVEAITRSLCRIYEKSLKDVAEYIANTMFDGLEGLIQLIIEYFSLYNVNFVAGKFFITGDIDPIVRTVLAQSYKIEKI